MVPYVAMLVAFTATLIIVWFDIWHASKTTFRFTGAACGYGFLLLLGSTVATMLAWPVLTNALAGRDQRVVEVIAGFAGVFGAQGLIRNMGVTLFGKEACRRNRGKMDPTRSRHAPKDRRLGASSLSQGRETASRAAGHVVAHAT